MAELTAEEWLERAHRACTETVIGEATCDEHLAEVIRQSMAAARRAMANEAARYLLRHMGPVARLEAAEIRALAAKEPL